MPVVYPCWVLGHLAFPHNVISTFENTHRDALNDKKHRRSSYNIMRSSQSAVVSVTMPTNPASALSVINLPTVTMGPFRKKQSYEWMTMLKQSMIFRHACTWVICPFFFFHMSTLKWCSDHWKLGLNIFLLLSHLEILFLLFFKNIFQNDFDFFFYIR